VLIKLFIQTGPYSLKLYMLKMFVLLSQHVLKWKCIVCLV